LVVLVRLKKKNVRAKILKVSLKAVFFIYISVYMDIYAYIALLSYEPLKIRAGGRAER
jgi:hypothetical protein